MNIQTAKGLVHLLPEPPAPIANGGDFLELAYGVGCPTIAVHSRHFVPEFFELKSGVAGDILQKVSNYRFRLIILGDFSQVASRALRDFIRESNQTGQVVFAPDLDQALVHLA